MEVEMVKIDEESALMIRDAVMSMVVRAVALSQTDAASPDEIDEEVDGINDYLCRAIGLDPEKVEPLEDFQ